MTQQQKAIVIGAGIVGMATARALALKGFEVEVFERDERAVGASIRNFGMIWPIGQPSGKLYKRARRSREIWQSICEEAGIWHDPVGSLHLAYHDDELQAIREYVNANAAERGCALLTPAEALEKSPSINPEGLLGALWSPDEMIVEAREAIGQVAAFLEKKYSIRFHWHTAIHKISYPAVFSGNQQWEADRIYVCSGVDFETLYPDTFRQLSLTKCKLQMMRAAALPQGQRIGPSLCGGLSMVHYPGFQSAPSLPALKNRYQQQYAEELKWGIHVMVSQNQYGELTIGDSHEYGLTHDPFSHGFINQMIINYLGTFTQLQSSQIIQHWVGFYPKMTNGSTELVLSPETGVTIINGVGGNGMTLSFGLAEEVINGEIPVSTL